MKANPQRDLSGPLAAQPWLGSAWGPHLSPQDIATGQALLPLDPWTRFLS